jgi:hypothetical protein
MTLRQLEEVFTRNMAITKYDDDDDDNDNDNNNNNNNNNGVGSDQADKRCPD